MKKYIILIIAISLISISCDDDYLNRYPESAVSPYDFFKSEDDLQLYVNGLYSYVPALDMVMNDFLYSDNIETSTYSTFLTGNRLVPASGGGWTWTYLRQVNYFLAHYEKAEIPDERKAYYAGIARFFRAWYYFDMMKKFGDLPWHSKPLETTDPDLYKARDSRVLITDSIVADLDYAIKWLDDEKKNTTITKWTALALKSRVCLYEGTFRKYHTDLGLSNSVGALLKECVKASEEMMTTGPYQVYNKEKATDYMDMFLSNTPNDEFILAMTFSRELNLLHSANYLLTSPSYQTQGGMTKQFIDSYLMSDGSFFSSKPDHKKLMFFEETKDRDGRLAQTICTPGYKRIDDTKNMLPNFGKAATGYQVIKFLTSIKEDAASRDNTNALPVFRYSEVLLNYAEAKAELGELTQEDLNMSVNLTRKRGGLPPLQLANIQVDPELQAIYPNASGSAQVLEVRRERRIELAFEGFRFDDLVRWRCGTLIAQRLPGMYFHKMGMHDLDGDGNNDFCIVKTPPATPLPNIQYLVLGDEKLLSNGDHGNLLVQPYTTKTFNEERDYLYPIPLNELTINKNLTQNPGWNF